MPPATPSSSVPSPTWTTDHRSASGDPSPRKSIAQFKLREGMPIGARVTLRGDGCGSSSTVWCRSPCPVSRDFRGLSDRQFDGRGNYTFGLNEQSMFHEINIDKIDRPRGMDITVVTTATTDDEGRALRHLGFPFSTTTPRRPDMATEGSGPSKAARSRSSPCATPGSKCGRYSVYLSSACAACACATAHAGGAAGRAEVQLVTPRLTEPVMTSTAHLLAEGGSRQHQPCRTQVRSCLRMTKAVIRAAATANTLSSARPRV